MDLAWTLQWVDRYRFKFEEQVKPYFLEDTNNECYTITCKDFFSLCNKKSKEFYKIKNKDGELFGFKQKKERMLTYKDCEYILKKYWLKSYIQILSVLIGEVDLEQLQCEYAFIKCIIRFYFCFCYHNTSFLTKILYLNFYNHSISSSSQHINGRLTYNTFHWCVTNRRHWVFFYKFNSLVNSSFKYNRNNFNS